MSLRRHGRLTRGSSAAGVLLLVFGPLAASPPANCPDNVSNLGEACTAGLGACEATGVVACTDLGIGTVRVKDIRPGPEGSDPEHLTTVGGVVFFYADDGTHGRELWKSDGTEEGTVLVKDINPGPDGSPPGDPIDHLRNVGGTLLFYADDGTNGAELWRSDGTETGTVMVKEINPGPNGSRHGPVELAGGAPFVVLDGELLFWADDGVIGSELWKSDGTEQGTMLVKDINPGPSDSLWPEFVSLVIDGVLFFGANDGTHGYELWRSDGTPDGTVLVKDIYPGSQNSLQDADFWANLDGTLLFSAADSTEVLAELWMSDGTEDGTVLVKDIDPRPTQGSFPADLVLAGDSVFFRGWPPDTGLELLKSDGTEEGTVLVRDINTGPIRDSIPDELTDVFGTLFFRGFQDDVGQELWKSDGTYQGTVMVKDIAPGPDYSYPAFLTPMNDAVFFSAIASGGTLWRSDGTEQGTVLLHPEVSAWDLVNVNGTLFFQGTEDETGSELWISDGTADGSRCDAVLGQATSEICGDFVDNDCDGSVDEGDALDALAWFMDADGDAFGDPDRPTTACGPLPGFVADATDCDDTDDQVWALPGETGNLRFSNDKITLSWDAPTTLGGSSVVYDTLRSETAGEFESIVSCIEQDDGADTLAIDVESPPAGIAYHYLVGAENGCGRGSVGTDSTGAQRGAAACP